MTARVRKRDDHRELRHGHLGAGLVVGIGRCLFAAGTRQRGVFGGVRSSRGCQTRISTSGPLMTWPRSLAGRTCTAEGGSKNASAASFWSTIA